MPPTRFSPRGYPNGRRHNTGYRSQRRERRGHGAQLLAERELRTHPRRRDERVRSTNQPSISFRREDLSGCWTREHDWTIIPSSHVERVHGCRRVASWSRPRSIRGEVSTQRGRGGRRPGFGVPDLWDRPAQTLPQTLLVIQIWREHALRRNGLPLGFPDTPLGHGRPLPPCFLLGFSDTSTRSVAFGCYLAALWLFPRSTLLSSHPHKALIGLAFSFPTTRGAGASTT